MELYRQGKVSHHQLATALGLGRLELDGVLKEHRVTEDCVTVEEYDQQITASVGVTPSDPPFPARSSRVYSDRSGWPRRG